MSEHACKYKCTRTLLPWSHYIQYLEGAMRSPYVNLLLTLPSKRINKKSMMTPEQQVVHATACARLRTNDGDTGDNGGYNNDDTHHEPSVMTTSATAIMAIAALGFVSVGMRAPTPELGLMMVELLPYYREAPFALLAPVIAIFTLLLGLTLLAGEHRP